MEGHTPLSKEVGLYFIAITPPPKIHQEIDSLKKHMRDKYGTRASLRSPPHITLHMPFKRKTHFESEIKIALEDFSHQRTSFDIQLQGFGAFEPRVIYVNVEPAPGLQTLKADLSLLMRKLLKEERSNYKNQPFRPHMTIAFRDLKKPAFHLAWEEFQNKSYQTNFECQSIQLLKHDGKEWHIFHSFPFAER